MSSKPSIDTLLVFGRDPRPGGVKTRLIPALGKSGATALYRQLLRRTLEVAAETDCTTRQLWLDGDCPAEDTVVTRRAATISLHQQQGSDLGERMAHALEQALRSADKAVLIGSDCPEYRPSYLHAAFAALDDHPVVLGPAADGGYVLVGLRTPMPTLFSDMPWSSDQVLAVTRRRLSNAASHWHELATLRDLDQQEDLQHFPELLPD